MVVKFEVSKEEGIHAALLRMAGNWEGIARTWFEPGVIADESPVKGSIRPVLDGRFLLHEYEGTFAGKPLLGMVIYGYDLHTGSFQSAWIDSFHMGTGIMFSRQQKASGDFTVSGTYQVLREKEEAWGWRTEIGMPDEDTLLITAYNISPDGHESKATEVVYKRKKD